MELIGPGYVIQHAVETLRREQKEHLYRVYVAETLRVIAHNTAKSAGGGEYIKARYTDIINDFDHPKPEETRTAREIIDTIRGKLAKLGGESA